MTLNSLEMTLNFLAWVEEKIWGPLVKSLHLEGEDDNGEFDLGYIELEVIVLVVYTGG